MGHHVRRFVASTAMAALVVGLIALGSAGAAPVRSPARPAVRTAGGPGRVALFGDSLAHEAKGAVALELARRTSAEPRLSTYPATALCDFRTAIAAELLARRPDVLVLEFSGNSGTVCMLDAEGALLPVGSEGWRARYLDDLRSVLAVARATGTRVLWATAPPLSPAKFATNYPRGLADAIRKVARTTHGFRVVDTGAALATAGHEFARTLPCRPDEAPYCEDGRVVVRSEDGLHFDCHGLPDPFGSCIGYSAGSRRFGEAIADAAVASAGY